MERKPKVYLAGPIESATDFGVGWRDEAKEALELLGFDVFSPTDHELGALDGYNQKYKEDHVAFVAANPDEPSPYFMDGPGGNTGIRRLKDANRIPLYREAMDSIARFDLDVVKNSDYILASVSSVASGGTSGEMTCAKYVWDIPVIAFTAEEPKLSGPDSQDSITNTLKKVSGWVLGSCDVLSYNLELGISELVKRAKQDGYLQ